MSGERLGKGVLESRPSTPLYPGLPRAPLPQRLDPKGHSFRSFPAKNTCCRRSRTPDTRRKQKKGKEKTPPLLIAFGWNPGCPSRYITPAQRDTCADAGAGPGTGGVSGLERGLGCARTGGQGEKERISG